MLILAFNISVNTRPKAFYIAAIWVASNQSLRNIPFLSTQLKSRETLQRQRFSSHLTLTVDPPPSCGWDAAMWPSHHWRVTLLRRTATAVRCWGDCGSTRHRQRPRTHWRRAQVVWVYLSARFPLICRVSTTRSSAGQMAAACSVRLFWEWACRV